MLNPTSGKTPKNVPTVSAGDPSAVLVVASIPTYPNSNILFILQKFVTESFVMTIGGNVLENNANVVELTPLNSVTGPVPPCLQGCNSIDNWNLGCKLGHTTGHNKMRHISKLQIHV